ncbi:MAG: polysaccharide deacetylase 2 family uncharacterized protein YibQ [Dinoroseobacter sp.]|jgi:polysaccharide deacetylase 2 family uncharacterized protein YibQ
MLKGLLSGVFWGAFASSVVVVGASLNAPLPGPRAGTLEIAGGAGLGGTAIEMPLVVPATEPEPTAPVPTRSALLTPEVPEAPSVPDDETEVEVTPEPQVNAPVETAPDPQAEVAEVETPEAGTPEIGASAPTLPDTSPVIDITPTPEQIEEPAPDVVPETLPEPEPEIETAVVTPDPLPGINDNDNDNDGTVEVPTLNSSLSLGGGALRRNALDIDLAPGLPRFSIVLIDRSGSGLPLAEVAGFPGPLTIALDPTQPGSIEAAAGYEATGHEVLVLANSLSENASPLEAAASLTQLLNQMPTAVGVLIPPGSPFVRDATRAGELIAILAQSGHGLVSLPQGLDALGRAAASSGVPDAQVFRVLDGDNEGVPLMTRYLDRAAFQASRDASVVVLGIVRPATMEALNQWVGGRRAAEVALAPISSLMLGQ